MFHRQVLDPTAATELIFEKGKGQREGVMRCLSLVPYPFPFTLVPLL
jgi:hypothetical protein